MTYNELKTMMARDTIQAPLAQCVCKIGTKRYNFMQMINLEADFDKTKSKVPILGKTGKGNKSSGWEGTGSATLHYNQSVFRKMMEHYKDTGEDMYFDVIIRNYDPTSAAGGQTVTLIGVNLDSIVLAKFDADGEYLDEDADFTIEDFTIGETFKSLDGFLIEGSDDFNFYN